MAGSAYSAAKALILVGPQTPDCSSGARAIAEANRELQKRIVSYGNKSAATGTNLQTIRNVH